ncbi:hypothetical protein PA598K_05636 [Paenibacillus sp. 598K]|uniref:hypothetical protein n=1 Tax=Paenibacillus sp. 598K TaxID=1117987 RepID=UPI000FFA959A|nr:hypothetical protein [Paenibacillus sp. 598K]GBF77112.1 hypothetical protein PA598K_05636 [Paenibacillus sp. 598K]
MHVEISRFVYWGALVGQYITGFVCLAALLQALTERPPRWLHAVQRGWGRRELPAAWLRLTGISRESASYHSYEALLSGLNMSLDPALYLAIRRLTLLGVPALMAGITLVPPAGTIAQGTLYLVWSVCVCLWGAALWDKPWLESLQRMRAQRITREIYVISTQLLYLSGSSLHIHTKLMRCLPYARAIRADLERLLAEWYQDADSALRRFKQRLGTDEGMTFAETIGSLRLHESEAYYRLLREHIQDYKEKIELARESRKESASYVLFLLAGVPILYMFQIFIHPWVQEGQKLFQSLN